MKDAALLLRRLDALRAVPPVPLGVPPPRRGSAHRRAAALAESVGGRVMTGTSGTYVRREVEVAAGHLNRRRLADLPGQPPIDAPLVCLDTETTGLATASGTLAFLVGLGWWDDGALRIVQLLLPDHADEPALLDAIAEAIPSDGWLVSYNGRAFDWPLLVARFRLARREPPRFGGHLDLLWHVRRLFRHRLDDARLRTVERELLGLIRAEDVEGWEIPGRYLGFLATDQPDALVDVVRHNEADVAALAALLRHIDQQLGDPAVRAGAPAGDLVGLARAFRRVDRDVDALACYDAALARTRALAPIPALPVAPRPLRPRTLPPWTGGVFGARVPARIDSISGDPLAPTPDRLQSERARLLRRMARHQEALAAWEAVAAGTGRGAIVAWVEIAKLNEHRFRDLTAALDAVGTAERLLVRSRMLGQPIGGLDADLRTRRRRLTARIARAAARAAAAAAGSARRDLLAQAAANG